MNKKYLIIFLSGICLGIGINAYANRSISPTGKVISTATGVTHPSGKAKAIPLIHKQMGAKSAYMGILEIQPGAGVPKHRDPTEEYIYFLDGGGELTIDGTKYTVKKGDTVYMPAKSEVSFKANSTGETKVLQVFAPQGPEKKYDSWK